MRRTNQVHFQSVADGVFVVVLSGASCAEHENGVARLHTALGCDASQAPGLNRRLAQANHADLQRASCLVEHSFSETLFREEPLKTKPEKTRIRKITRIVDTLSLIVGRYIDFNRPGFATNLIEDLGRRYGDGTSKLTGAWDEESFLITGYDTGRETVRDLHTALIAGDLALWVARPSKNPFEQNGLTLAIASRVPAILQTAMIDNDVDQDALQKAAQDTGVKDRIDAQAAKHDGRFLSTRYRYYSLTPVWCTTADTSKHHVKFWLNPMNSQTDKSGYYTVEELDAWLSGKGPVLKHNN